MTHSDSIIVGALKSNPYCTKLRIIIVKFGDRYMNCEWVLSSIASLNVFPMF